MNTYTKLIAGVDEAGRGPWAGPVSVAAVILNPQRPIIGLNDSKKLSEGQREALFEQICAQALAVSAVFVNAQTIDQMNIREATLWGMVQAVRGLSIAPEYVYIDGRDVPKPLREHYGSKAKAIIGGDASDPAISAASIIAKVMRDRAMHVLDTHYPEYGFARHKGYGTAMHQRALAQWGACPIHRTSFKPVRAVVGR